MGLDETQTISTQHGGVLMLMWKEEVALVFTGCDSQSYTDFLGMEPAQSGITLNLLMDFLYIFNLKVLLLIDKPLCLFVECTVVFDSLFCSPCLH